MRHLAAVVIGVLLVTAATLAVGGSSAQAAVKVEQWNTPGGPYVNRKDEFPRDLVDGKLITSIVLPDGYSTRKCWPVLYLLHGTASSDDRYPASVQWLRIEDGQLLKMNLHAIVVVPGSGDTWWVNNWWGGLRHPAYESWVLQSIVPMVQRRLHVCADRSDHAIAGLSMGGYGAMLLGSQLPGYFGTVGSFSGVLSPDSPNFRRIYPAAQTLWGPAGGFYANGKDPMALINNLRHTRLFVGVGDGRPTLGESTSFVPAFEEAEFEQEDVAFVNKARSLGVPVKFDLHPGTHDSPNWFRSLTDMLRWGAFRHVPRNPRAWTYSTVESSGTAWGYQFQFARYGPPSAPVEFSLNGRVFRALGAGVVTLRTPSGRVLRASLPFQLDRGHLRHLGHARIPVLRGGYENVVPVNVVAGGSAVTSPVSVSFVTKQPLPSDQLYQVDVTSMNASCHDLTTQVVAGTPAPGATVRVSLMPAQAGSMSGSWCPGLHYVGVVRVPKAGPHLLGTILGYSAVTLR